MMWQFSDDVAVAELAVMMMWQIQLMMWQFRF